MLTAVFLFTSQKHGGIMRRWVHSVVLGTVVGVGLGIGCATSNNETTGGAGGTSAGPGSGSGTGTGTGTGGNDAGFDANENDALDPDAACAKFTEEAKQAPAAMLFVLDASASMTQAQKWGTAQLATVSAIDKDVFDTMSLGLVRFPATFVDMPPCLCDALGGPGLCEFLLPNGVACGVSFLPQIPITPAGTEKSNAPTGVRHDIYQDLSAASPVNDGSDASPIYDALVAGYNALKAYPIDKRLLVLVTDGGFSCTSLSEPPRPGYTDGACLDWEYPDSVNSLITAARTDATKPIFTFVVGVPGSNSNGEMQGSYATAPYSMQLALSTYAVSGSPDTVDPACDKTAVFAPNGPAPAAPCHIDLSGGGVFNPDTLSDAITAIRGKALGCVYDLPAPPEGEEIQLDQVNVQVTIDAVTVDLKKRSNPADDCAAEGCWDYTSATPPQVELLGKACIDLGNALEAKVDIIVGCETILQ